MTKRSKIDVKNSTEKNVEKVKCFVEVFVEVFTVVQCDTKVKLFFLCDTKMID